ncbi:glycosyl hydrolase family 28-related protein [Paenibacillus sp. MBLB4367]|uniref:glycosyl hydrolase family 28-related protein n=1 Tax=Paenibacillus sp. MBLB4367 TaxID=3384767 RepID=UPI0039080FA7
MLNEKKAELTEQQNPEQEKGFISRRKLLASIGMAGAALATTGLINGALTKAYADPAESRTKVKDLMNMSMVALTTIAQLRAITQPEADVYLITDRGHEGHFAYDASDTTSADNTGTVLVTAGGKRFKRLPETEFVSVKWFGAKGDGTTDDSAAIQAANAYAASVHSALCFPYGTYRGSGLRPTTSWYSFENAVIRSNASVQPSTFHGDFVKVEGQSNLVFEGLTFDGNVSADPSTWSAATYNAFSGSVAFYLLNASQIKLRNCIFQNSFFSTIRMVGCHAIDVESCTTRKARGNFGDAVYVEGSYDVKYDRCHAEDYTRIGYVTESGTSSVTYSQCYAYNGHNGSIMYGGAESNAGFWSEQSENVSFSQCVAENNAHRGFVCVTMHASTITKQTEVAAFMLDSCLSINNLDYAFVMNGATHDVISVSCNGCYAYGSNFGFHLTGSDNKDAFHFTNCFVHLSFADAAKPYVGFVINNEAAEPSTTSVVNMMNCGTILGDGDKSSLVSKDSLSGDVVVYSGAKAIVTVDQYTNVGEPGHMVLKSLDGSPTIRVRNCKVTVPVIHDFTELSFDSCNFGSLSHLMGKAAAQGRIRFDHCEVNGPMALVTTGRISMNDSAITLSGAAALRIVRGNSSNHILTEFHNCRFEKDISANDYVLHIKEDGALKPKSVFHHCTFYQTSDSPTSSKPFVWLENSGTPALFTACYADDTVVSILRTGATLSAPSGVTLIDLH